MKAEVKLVNSVQLPETRVSTYKLQLGQDRTRPAGPKRIYIHNVEVDRIVTSGVEVFNRVLIKLAGRKLAR